MGLSAEAFAIQKSRITKRCLLGASVFWDVYLIVHVSRRGMTTNVAFMLSLNLAF
jgi:hypothetical protein